MTPCLFNNLFRLSYLFSGQYMINLSTPNQNVSGLMFFHLHSNMSTSFNQYYKTTKKV